MNLGELLAEARSRANDNATPSLWSDAEFTSWANEAEREACRRARLIIDSTTLECCRITLAIADPTYELHEKVLFIRRAKLVGRAPVLRRVSFQDLDETCPGWEDETGEPRGYIPDMDNLMFRPYPIPTAVGVVNLTITRLPLEDMAAAQDEPEIRSRFHLNLVPWMLYRAYSKQDAETIDLKKAGAFLAEFEAEFGKRSSAIDELWLEREHDFIEAEGNF